MRRTANSLLTIVGLMVLSTLGTLGQNSKNNSKASLLSAQPVKLSLPLKDGSVRFAVIGDTGTGTKKQQELANVMLKYQQAFPFDAVLLLGDNLYGTETPVDYQKK